MIYFVCAWNDYYPNGGIGNIKYKTDSYDLAEIAMNKLMQANRHDRYCIFDSSDIEEFLFSGEEE